MASGDIMLDADGNVILDADGNILLDDGAGNACCCGTTYYVQAKRCSDSAAADVWLQADGSGNVLVNGVWTPVPVYFNKSGTLYKVLASYPTSTTHGTLAGTVTVASGSSCGNSCSCAHGDTPTMTISFSSGITMCNYTCAAKVSRKWDFSGISLASTTWTLEKNNYDGACTGTYGNSLGCVWIYRENPVTSFSFTKYDDTAGSPCATPLTGPWRFIIAVGYDGFTAYVQAYLNRDTDNCFNWYMFNATFDWTQCGNTFTVANSLADGCPNSTNALASGGSATISKP